MTKNRTSKKSRRVPIKKGPKGPHQPDPNQIAHGIISKIIERTEGTTNTPRIDAQKK